MSKKKHYRNGLCPDVTEFEIIEIALDYLKSGKVYIRTTTLALVVIKKILKPDGHLATATYDSGFVKICSKVIRKLSYSGAIEKWSRVVYRKTELAKTITAKTVMLTSLNTHTPKGKKKDYSLKTILELKKLKLND